MDNLQPVYAATAAALAEQHGITARRVRQYVEDGLLPRLDRGLFDAVWFLYLRIGEHQYRNSSSRPSAYGLVVSGWLGGVSKKPNADDIDGLVKLFVRNRLSRDQAMIALGEARVAV